MLHIRAFNSDFGGCFYYRMRQPLAVLKQAYPDDLDYEISRWLKVSELQAADIGYFQRVFSQEMVAGMRSGALSGTKLIIDLDDDVLGIPPHNPAFELTLGTEGFKASFLEALDLADALFVTTAHLKQKYSKYCKNIAIIPNMIYPPDFEPWTRLNNNKKFVVGYQGSMTHYKDLAMISDALTLLIESPEIVVKSFGNRYEKVHNIPVTLFDSLYGTLAALDFDVGIAPLVNDEFNRSKSNIKWLEYSMVGTPTVASPVGPYRCIRDGVDGYWAETTCQWLDKIMSLTDPDLAAGMVKAVQERILTEYNIVKHYKIWADNFQAVANGRPVQDFVLEEKTDDF